MENVSIFRAPSVQQVSALSRFVGVRNVVDKNIEFNDTRGFSPWRKSRGRATVKYDFAFSRSSLNR